MDTIDNSSWLVNYYKPISNKLNTPDVSTITPVEAVNLSTAKQRRIRQLEPIILTRVDPAISYARTIIKGRWPELEHRLLEDKDPEAILKYANLVVRGRFIEGERILASNPPTAVIYARQVLKGRFPMGERQIRQDKNSAMLYTKFLKTIGETFI